MQFFTKYLFRQTLQVRWWLALLLSLGSLTSRAQQVPCNSFEVQVTPAGPLTLPTSGAGTTLTATATVPGFNVSGTGFDGPVYAVLKLSTGKVLVGGRFYNYNGQDVPDGLVRLNADGSFDNTFSTLSQPGVSGSYYYYAEVHALVEQADGKVIVGGAFSNYNNTDVPDGLVRLSSTGAYDNTFNGGQTGFIISSQNIVYALALQSDGKLLVGGLFNSYNGAGVPNGLVRLSSTGALDNAFNSGQQGISGGYYYNAEVHALAVQADGKVIIGGAFSTYNNQDVPDGLVRLSSTGAYDNTFNGGQTGFSIYNQNIVYALALQPDGKLLVGGLLQSYNNTNSLSRGLLRLSSTGALDNAFNSGQQGISGSYHYNAEVHALAVQADGKIIAGGYFSAYNGADVPDGLLRVSSAGVYDNTFNGGQTGFSINTYGNVVWALVLQADEKVLVGGEFTNYNGSSTGVSQRLLRLNTDGSLNNVTTAVSGVSFAWTGGSTGSTLLVTTPGTYQATGSTGATCSVLSNAVVVNWPPLTVTPSTVAPSCVGASDGTATATATGGPFGTTYTYSWATSPVQTTATATGLAAGSYSVTVTDNTGATVTASAVVSSPPVYSVSVTPIGPATLPTNGSGLTLTATATLPGFNSGGTGFDGTVYAVLKLSSGKMLVGGSFYNYNGQDVPDGLARLNADGTVDATFNPGGRGFQGSYYLEIRALAEQADGRILVGGLYYDYNGTTVPQGLLRLTANGAFDNTFNVSGTGIPQMYNNYNVYAVAVQADGKVLVGGSFSYYNSTVPYGLMRLTSTGTLDSSYNPSGTGTNYQQVYALALQADGKLLVGGAFTDYANQNTPDGLMRLNTDGTLDAAFNAGGVGFGGYSGYGYYNHEIHALALQADGSILVGGRFGTYNSQNTPKDIVRLTSAGVLDNTFNPGGFGVGINNYDTYTVNALAVQADGKVLIGGSINNYNGQSAPSGVMRLTNTGTLDNTFNAGGLGTQGQAVYALVLQADGKPVIGGQFTQYNGTGVQRLTRLNTDGSLNSLPTPITGVSFAWTGGSTGSTLLVTTPGTYQATGSRGNAACTVLSNAVVVSWPPLALATSTTTPTCLGGTDGTATATATGGPAGNTYTYRWATSPVQTTATATGLAAGSYTVTATDNSGATITATAVVSPPATYTLSVTPAGPLTLPLNGSGLTLTATATVPGFNAGGTGFDGGVYAVLKLSSGKVLVGGRFSNYNGTDVPDGVARLNADGTVDATFNPSGQGFSGTSSYTVRALAEQADGNILVGGYFNTFNGQPVLSNLVRLTANGAVDATFNPGGTSFGQPYNSYNIYALAVQADGKLLVGGQFTQYSGQSAPGGVLRLTSIGVLDATFNAGGSGVAGSSVFALAVQADGKVLIGGDFSNYNGVSSAGLARLNADGSMDAAFNAGGQGFGALYSAQPEIRALAVQTNGSILVGGRFVSYNGLTVSYDLVRLTASGALDATFNSGGQGVGPYPNGSIVYALAVQADDKVVIGGYFQTYNNATSPGGVLRLSSTGTLDGTFNPGGAGTNYETVNALALQADGKIVVGGEFNQYNGTSTGVSQRLVRLNANGSLNNAPTPITGVSFAWTGGSTGSTLVVSTPGTYQATGSTAGSTCTVLSNAVVVNWAPLLVTTSTTTPTCVGGTNGTATATATGGPFGTAYTYSWNTSPVQTTATATGLTSGSYTVTATDNTGATTTATAFVAPPVSYTVSVTPAGPVGLPAGGGSLTLTATAAVPGFNVSGTGFDGTVYAVLKLSTGKVLVGGNFTTYNGTNVPDGLVRLNADGTFDGTFSALGQAGLTGSSPYYNNAEVRALMEQADGKVIVGGSFLAYNGTDVPDGLMRLSSAGTPDASFNGGQPGFDVVSSGSMVYALALQADGKLLAGGRFQNYNGARIPGGIVRLTSTGAVDNTFNPGGTGAVIVSALALQSDGKIVVVGSGSTYNGASTPNGLLRLTGTGTVDNTFNAGGQGFAAPSNYNLEIKTLALQADGNILVGGRFISYNGIVASSGLVRVSSTGVLDNTFNAGGQGFGSTNSYYSVGTVSALALQPDGKMLVGGQFTQYNTANVSGGVLRLGSNGALDNTFNNGQTGVGTQQVNALALQADGKVVIGGYFTQYNGTSAGVSQCLLRLNGDGSRNNVTVAVPGVSFAWTGGSTGSTLAVTTPGTYQATATSGSGCTVLSNAVVVTYPVVVVATSTTSPTCPGGGDGTARATATGGAPGTTYTYRWATAPVQTTATATGLTAGTYTVTVRDNSGLSTTATATVTTATPPYNVTVTPAGPLALPANGSGLTLTAAALTPGFNPNGTGFDGAVYAVLRLSTGKWLVGGSFTTYNGTNVPDKLARLNADGTADNTFNTNGQGFDSDVRTLVEQPDGLILAGGNFSSYNSQSVPRAILRLTANGSYDNTFNGGQNGFPYGTVYAIALQPDGRVVVGGDFDNYNYSFSPHGLNRLNADGSFDYDFNYNNTGYGYGYGLNGGTVYALALQASGEILVGGNFNSMYDNQYGLSQDVPDGLMSVDYDGNLSYFNSGQQGFSGYFYGSEVRALAVQPDGSVLVGGSFYSYNYQNVPNGLLRLDAYGNYDYSFNGGQSGFSSSSGYNVRAIALQPDNKIVVGGYFQNYNGTASPGGVLRLSSTGGRDNTFNPGGAGTGNQAVNALALQADGRILMGGEFTQYNGTSTNVSQRLARLNTNGSLNSLTPVPNVTYAWTGGGTGSTLTVTTPGDYRVTASTGGTCGVVSNTVTVTWPNLVVSAAAGVQGNYNDVTITGATTGGTGVATLSGALTVSGTLTVQAGGTLAPACQPITGAGAFALEAGATLRICDADGIMATASRGAVRLTGTRSYSPGAFYEYVGTVAQTTGDGLPATVAGLTLGNATGLTLSQAVATQATTLSQGVLSTGTYTLTLPATGTITETDASYVLGRVSVPGRSLASATAETFGGIGLTLTPAAASTAFPGLTNVVRTTGMALTLTGASPSIQRYFDIQPATNSGLNVTMNFTYFDHERNGIAAGNVALYKSVSSLSGPWANQSPISIAANTVTKTGIADFSIWTLGGVAAPLPVTLTDFVATRQGANAQLVWNTASEKNNDHFEVEVSTDGRQFQALGNVAGHGTTAQAQHYTFLDKGIARYGVAQLYYRLRQVDTDSTATTSPVRTVRVELRQAGPATFVVYPTVADGGPVRYLYEGPALAPGTSLEVYDVTGRRVWQQAASAVGTDIIALPALSTGWYQVMLLRAEGRLNARFYRP